MTNALEPPAGPVPLYRRLLGARFDELPIKVRELHDVQGSAVWTGEADVDRGTSLVARLIGSIARLPPTARNLPLRVTFTSDGSGEIWRREFGRHVFPTYQSLGDGVILERIGPSTVSLKPQLSPQGLSLTVTGLTVLGLPVPRRLLSVVTTREFEADGRYRFEVEAMLPLFGRLVRYSGWLQPAADAQVEPTSATRP